MSADKKAISKKEEIDLEMIGLCTDICVVSNALLLKACMPEVKISVDAACCEQFRKQLSGENVPQHIFAMESILDKAIQKMDALEKKNEEYEAFQTEIQKLESYYTSCQWKDDLAMERWESSRRN